MNWKKEWTVPTVTGVISFGVGVAVGYAATYYKYKKIEQMVEEIESSTSELEHDMIKFSVKLDDRSHHIQEALQYAWNIVGQVSNDEHDANEEPEGLEESVTNHPTNSGMPMTNEVDIEKQTIFVDEESGDVWDYKLETDSRTPENPFVIHRDEFEDGEDGYGQSTLTYYKGDEILTDEDDTPVYNPERIVGELKFGHGSNDPNVVYIRNDKLMADYEVILDHGYFQVEVLGEEIENSLSRENSVIPKFRPSD